jgi:hypothetical protein
LYFCKHSIFIWWALRTNRMRFTINRNHFLLKIFSVKLSFTVFHMTLVLAQFFIFLLDKNQAQYLFWGWSYSSFHIFLDDLRCYLHICLKSKFAVQIVGIDLSGYSNHFLLYCNILGGSSHDGTLLHSKSQHTTVTHSQKLFEHTYTSNPYGLGTLAPIEFFQQDLLWQSSNTHSHSCSQKASKHSSGQSIVGLSVHLHTTMAPRRIVHH